MCGGWYELHRKRKVAWRQVFKALVAMEFGVVKGELD